MSITNPVALPAIAFSKNLLNLLLQSDDYLAAAAVQSVNFAEFDAAVVEDDEVELSWNNGAATMTAKDSPDDSGLEFPSGDGSEAYVTSLLPWFRGNYILARDYVITTDFSGPNPRLVFTAIKNGPDYDFPTAANSGNTTPGVTDDPRVNFLHHLELFIATADSEFIQAFDANIPLDYPVTGITTVDIHEALHAFLESDYPELVEDFAICNNSIRPYFFKMAQFYGSTPWVRKLIASDTFFINKGGLSKQAALLRDIVAELCPVDGHPELNRFLRQGSINKLVTPLQPEWLTWINFTGSTKNIALEVTIFNDDGSTFVFHPVDSFSALPFQKTQFPCGYAQLDIAGQQTDESPIYYTCQVIDLDTSSPLTASYAFVIDYTFRPWPRYFVYENSYGAFQTLATVGKALNEYDRTTDSAQMAVDLHTAAITGEFLECNVLLQDKGTVNIGYDRSDPRTTALLRDFLLSRTKYLWDNGVLEPIGLNTKNLKDAADGVYVYANSFEWYFLYQEEVYSEPEGLPDNSIADLLTDAGTPVPPALIPVSSGNIIVEFGDAHLGTDTGRQDYTATALAGLTNYRIWTTQQDKYFLTSEIQYNASGFTILQPGFELVDGEQLIIQPQVLNPDV